MMTIGSLFAGIGGLELGLEWAGMGGVLWQVENDDYCIKVLEKHWPKVKRFNDVKTVGSGNLAPVDLICGGFPCQDISAAGKGEGLSGTRSGLWYEFYRLVHELEPRWIIVENVASAASRWVDTVRGGLELIGYETLPVPISAFDVGAPHLRRRIFIIARAVETWSLRKWRSGGGRTIPDAQRHRIRLESKRVPRRRPGAIQGEGQTEPVDNGAKESLADPDSPGQSRERLSKRPRLQSAPGSKSNRRSDDGKLDDPEEISDAQGERLSKGGPGRATTLCKERIAQGENLPDPQKLDERAGFREGDTRGDGGRRFSDSGRKVERARGWAVEPDVGRVAHGIPSRVDRLRCLGNAVVPQCSEVIGWIVKEIENGWNV
jgi:DNA (cytosine-5)-methyltransferase 1